MNPRTDCRHFRAVAPCTPHKTSGARCTNCGEYDPVRERILVVKLGAMGDVLRTTSLLPPLRQRHPNAQVTWVALANARPLLEGNPLIDRVLTIEDGYLEYLLAEEFDLAIGPDADVRSASIMRLVRSAAKRGFVADGRGNVVPLTEAARAWWHTGLDDTLKKANRRTYGAWLYDLCELSEPVASPFLPVSRRAETCIAQFLSAEAGGARKRVCLSTGASARWREKRWKLAHYRDLVRQIAEVEPDTAVILVGGPEEAAFNAALLASTPSLIDAGTDRPVEELGALMAACDWALTSDSLSYHVACATGTPAVCVVGPTSPWELDLFGRNLVLHSDVECIACYRSECALPITCMDLLSAAQVLEHLRAWLEERFEAGRLVGRVVSVRAIDARSAEGDVLRARTPRATLRVLNEGVRGGGF